MNEETFWFEASGNCGSRVASWVKAKSIEEAIRQTRIRLSDYILIGGESFEISSIKQCERVYPNLVEKAPTPPAGMWEGDHRDA